MEGQQLLVCKSAASITPNEPQELPKEANKIAGYIITGVTKKVLLKVAGKRKQQITEVSVALVLPVLGCQMWTKRNHKILQLYQQRLVALSCSYL